MMDQSEEDLGLEIETNKKRKFPSEGCIACAGFCGLPIVVLMSFAVLYQTFLTNHLGNTGEGRQAEQQQQFGKPEISNLSRQPEQIHIAIGVEKNSILVSWMTPDFCTSTVKLGLDPTGIKTDLYQGETIRFQETANRIQYVHSVTLTNLKSNLYYFYEVGSEEGGWSDVYWFKTLADDQESISFAYFGDFGSTNAVSLPKLQEETHEGVYDLLIHAGDMAYDLDDDEGRVGDAFMRQVEPIAAYVPYMTSPGNHEHPDDYLEYRNRFLMPLSDETRKSGELHYSFDLGPVHFISLNVEVYYKNGGTVHNVSRQYEWLINDLQSATTPENRSKHPWIIIFGHRGMYCSPGWWDCAKPNTKTRVGIEVGKTLKYGLEELLMKYNVDLCMWAHKHNYERLWPIYNYTVYKPDSVQTGIPDMKEETRVEHNDLYNDPKAPVHITTGTAGSKEGLAWWARSESKDPDFLAAKSFDYGFTKIRVHNSSHLQLEQISIDKGGIASDEIWVVNYDHNFSKNVNEEYFADDSLLSNFI